ncbi:MAG: tRNA uridine-5-carboxymethylaminomethyl(34) synthesis GTPase MnmE [Clostridia bacterium]|nr:tRNA uridine-5-carboxymethylaminomethyl(34) synthesis GTPase MnmE [Clostridia bacterium]
MDTIAAISTATGAGGIGIIRMSGKDTFSILRKIFRMKENIEYDKIPGYTMKYGYIINTNNLEKIDEVLVTFFKNPKSYTREDMCEINSHGGVVVEKLILEQCLNNGAKLAEPGEFTKRAFLNGRIDLTQAESIIDIINSKTEKESRAAINQLEGGLAKKIKIIKDLILDILSDIEATIDYPEYDIEGVTNTRILSILDKISNNLTILKNSFDNGKILKDGIKTVIIGKPNVGKSSLLNAILDEERAIVSDVEGTTRDTIEEYVNINGICLKLIDTAGIRNTENEIEEIGVQKALQSLKNADLVIVMFDISKEMTKEDLELLNKIKSKKSIIVLNKIDKNENNFKLNMQKYDNVIELSAQSKKGIDKLYQKIEKMYNLKDIEAEDRTIITNIRHKREIEDCLHNIKKAANEINKNMQIDIVSIYIKEALENLNNITGESVSEDIINKIFSKFCLGK